MTIGDHAMTTKILAVSLGLAGLLAYVGCGGSDTSTGDLGNTAGTSSAGTAGSTAKAGGGQGGDTSGAGGETAGSSGAGAGEGGAQPSGGSAGSGGDSGTSGQGGMVDDPFAGPSVCTSAKHWTQGDHESPNMHPGGTCITCHKEKEPFKSSIQFTVAGTVFPTGHEPTDCNGINATTTTGVEIEITGADGAVTTIPVSLPSGNFYKKFSLKMPYKALVRYDGKERAMTVEQTSGDCNSCHTEKGAEGAPGRIVLP